MREPMIAAVRSVVPPKQLKEVEARQLVAEFQELCQRHGLWVNIREEWKPHLSMLKIEEISIKIDK